MHGKKYNSIDGLRTIACVGIVALHMFFNNGYVLPWGFLPGLIESMKYGVLLFMEISAFCMCCGYLEKMQNGQVSMEQFYVRRYVHILPFFSCLVLLDVLLSRSIPAVIEGFADLTLLFGLFPNNIQVIGVGWFLGLIFAFYLIFPFYSVLLKTKKRGWCCFCVSLLLTAALEFYFGVYYENIAYSLSYFLAGGLIYLYREPLERFSRQRPWAVLALLAVCIFGCIRFYGFFVWTLLSSSLAIIYAIGRTGGLLDNRVTHFISSVSLEIYLSHMVVFRMLEKLKLNTAFGNGLGQYLVTILLTLTGAAFGAVIFQKIWSVLVRRR